MSLAASPTVPVAARRAQPRLWPLATIAWAATAVSLLLLFPRPFDAMSTDDFMRLTEVRDFLAGQGWFDVTQYRLDPPAGVFMHWSRLVDVPIAALILALTPFLGRAGAEAAAASAWPLVLLLPATILTGALARRLANAAAVLPAVFLLAASAPFLVHFRPGALDHHGVQLTLLLATLYGVTAGGSARLWPALGGVAAALSIAVGIEMVPALAAILAGVGLRWAIEGERTAKLTASFGLAFGGATALLFVATIPPARWGMTVCDQIALPFAVAAGLSGGLMALLAAASPRLASARLRLIAGSVAGAGVGAAVALAFPACLQDPFIHLDPQVAAVWLANVAETQNVFAFMRNAPDRVLPSYGPPVAALGLALAALWRAPQEIRAVWTAPLLALVTLCAVTLWEIRAGSGAAMIAWPLAAAALVRLLDIRTSLLASRTALLALFALSMPMLAFAGQAVGRVASHFALKPSKIALTGPLSCPGLDSVAPLAQLAPGLVASHINLGSAILAATKHTVLAAPYHRNIEGNRIAFAILLGDDATAKRLLAERHVDYVAICPGTAERFNLRKAAPDGLAERLARGEVPPYLAPVAGDPLAPLKIFRVR